MMKVFGENVRIARSCRNLSQNKLSEYSGISRSSLSMIENHEIDIYFRTAQKIAKSLNISLPQLFSRNFSNGNILAYTEDDFLFIFSQNAKNIIKKQHRFQLSLYSSTTLSSSTISEIFNQKVNPKLSSLKKIADALNTPINELIIRKEE